MAKQTFTTGQVLTAAQMTSLQQTAMGGGSATAKTTSYVLVAADAGTVVAMNAAGATTITVNTSLFGAGDSVFIQNWGAGTCTVTAGTATVTTHGSLALSQYEGGTLYFTSASAAIFFDISQTSGMTNPMTTTGDMIYSSSGSTPARLGIGSTGNVLTVAGGVPSWAAPASGGGMTLISTTSLTGASVTLSSIPGTYKNLQLVIRNYLPSQDGYSLQIRMNGDSGANRHYTTYTVGVAAVSFNNTQWGSTSADKDTSNGLYVLDLYDYANTATWKIGRTLFIFNDETTATNMRFFQTMHAYNQTSAITSIGILTDATSFTGTALLYGVS